MSKVAAPAMVEVTVLRAFYHNGKVLEKDKTYVLPEFFAAEMVAAKKVSIVTKAVVEPAAPAAPKKAEAQQQAPVGTAKKER